MERVILTTGGTGGHIFPAMAVAEEILRRYPEASILFMGGKYGPEGDIAAAAGLDFIGLPVRGVIGRGLKAVGAGVAMLAGIRKAAGILRKFDPDLMVGFGGYAAFAGMTAGVLAGRVTAVHEQNAFPGMTNRLLGKRVKRVFVSMPDASGVFPAERTTLVGNPVRAAIGELYEARMRELREPAVSVEAPAPTGSLVSGSLPEATANGPLPRSRRSRRLLVMGGSQGARAVNHGMVEAAASLLAEGVDIRHQTGQADYEEIRAAYQKAGITKVRVEPFITDMAGAYAWADLALCRAGASSIAELACAGLPAVLVPFPFAAQDHQRYNARFLQKEGGAVLLEQADFYGPESHPDVLIRTLLDLFKDDERLAWMSERCLTVAEPYAARNVVDGLETLIGNR